MCSAPPRKRLSTFLPRCDLSEDFCIRFLNDSLLSHLVSCNPDGEPQLGTHDFEPIVANYVPAVFEAAQDLLVRAGPVRMQYRERRLVKVLSSCLSTPQRGLSILQRSLSTPQRSLSIPQRGLSTPQNRTASALNRTPDKRVSYLIL